MENEKNLIRREAGKILWAHFAVSIALLLVLGMVLFVWGQYEHPDDWQETTFVLEDWKYVQSSRSSRLDLYTTDGRRFVINRDENKAMAYLVPGQQYTVLYADDVFHDMITDMRDGDIVFIDYEDSLGEYHGIKAIFGILAALAAALLVAANAMICFGQTRDSFRRIRAALRRSRERRDKL